VTCIRGVVRPRLFSNKKLANMHADCHCLRPRTTSSSSSSPSPSSTFNSHAQIHNPLLSLNPPLSPNPLDISLPSPSAPLALFPSRGMSGSRRHSAKLRTERVLTPSARQHRQPSPSHRVLTLSPRTHQTTAAPASPRSEDNQDAMLPNDACMQGVERWKLARDGG